MASNAFWCRWRAVLKYSQPKTVESASFDSAAGLTLPRIGEKSRTISSSGGLEYETYEDFARQAEWENPDIVFTKDSMDAAFRMALSRVGTGALIWTGSASGVLARVSV